MHRNLLCVIYTLTLSSSLLCMQADKPLYPVTRCYQQDIEEPIFAPWCAHPLAIVACLIKKPELSHIVSYAANKPIAIKKESLWSIHAISCGNNYFYGSNHKPAINDSQITWIAADQSQLNFVWHLITLNLIPNSAPQNMQSALNKLEKDATYYTFDHEQQKKITATINAQKKRCNIKVDPLDNDYVLL